MFLKIIRCWLSDLYEYKPVEMYRRNGFLFTLLDIFYKFGSNSILHFRIYEVMRREQINHYHLEAQRIQIQKATLTDARFLSACGYSTTTLREWIQQGIEGWYIVQDGHLLGCTWIDINDSYLLYKWMVLQTPSKAAWIHWWWVKPEFRGKEVAYRILPYPQNLTVSRMAVIDYLNRSALHGARKLGWIFVNRLVVFRLYKLKFVWFKGRLTVGLWQASTPLRLAIE